jgi:hypothetical protein
LPQTTPTTPLTAPLSSPRQARRGDAVCRLLVLALAVGTVTLQDSNAANTYDYSRAASVLVSVEVRSSAPRLWLVWAPEAEATAFLIFRKPVQAREWGSPVARLPGTATSWADPDAAVGEVREYAVLKRFRLGETERLGSGYVCAGVEAPMIDHRGTVVLVVDRTHAEGLRVELDRLQQDLVGDGWQVLRHDVSPSDSPAQVKALITADYQADPMHVRAVFLLGHVPIPRSGWEAPDGHGNHQCAWPADTYYGDMDGQWTDETVNETNQATGVSNLPGDGQFDQIVLPSALELEVGRVDLADMPAFGADSEERLLRQYLDKDHNWRYARLAVPMRGYVSDSFRTAGHSFAQNGFRNFAALCGFSQITVGSGLPEDGYAWAYGCGPGGYTSAAGVASTEWFARHDPKLVFTMLFGSYFGDWAARDCLLRAPLATTYGLSCCWAASPNYFFHHLALGWNLGYSVRLSQNNSGLYLPVASHDLARGVWSALMGDPTLRLQPIPPPSAAQARPVPGGVKVSWRPSGQPVEGYALYRSTAPDKPFVRIMPGLARGISFVDTNPAGGARRYMVRAVALQTSAGGTYYNPSQGVFTGWVSAGGSAPAA